MHKYLKHSLFKITLEEALQLLVSTQLLLETFRTIVRLTCGKNSSQRFRLPLVIEGENGNSIFGDGCQALQRECRNRVDFNLQKREVITAYQTLSRLLVTGLTARVV